MFRTTDAPIPAGRRRWLATISMLLVVLVPLSMFAHDLRVTFGTAALVLAADSVMARMNGGSRIVQLALWVGAAGCLAAACFAGAHLHR